MVKQLSSKGHSLRLLVRDGSKFDTDDGDSISIIVGDATRRQDVERLMIGVDCVISLLGNVKINKKYTTIMQASHANILAIAAQQETKPQCLFISTIGCGGSSWMIKTILSMIVGKPCFNDYEAADQQIREQSIVPSIVVRPYALNDNIATGKYRTIKNHPVHFAKPLARADLATCLVNMAENNRTTHDVIHVVG